MCSRKTESSNPILLAPASPWAGPFIPASLTPEELKALELHESPTWLRAAGFDLGQACEVEVRAGELVIRAV